MICQLSRLPTEAAVLSSCAPSGRSGRGGSVSPLVAVADQIVDGADQHLAFLCLDSHLESMRGVSEPGSLR